MFQKLPSVLKVFRRNCQVCCNPCKPTMYPCNWSMLPNGVRIITETKDTLIACVSLFVEAGPRYEIACNNGIAHFIEHFAFKGFRALKRQEFECLLRCQGFRLSAYTTREYQVFSAIGPAELTGFAINYLSRIVYDLDLNDYDIIKERKIIEMELIDAEKDAKTIMFDYLHQTAFQGTPLAQRVIGPSANIARFDKYFVLRHLQEHYQPYRLVLSVSGGISHENVVCFAQESLGALEAAPCDKEFWPCRFTGGQIMYRDDSMKQAHVAIAVEVPGYGSPEFLRLQTLKMVFSRWDLSIDGGYKAWPPLAQAAACTHMCTSYETFYLPYRDVGLWGVYFVAPGMEVEDMSWSVQEYFKYLCTIIVEGDAERAVNNIKLEVAKSLDGVYRSSIDLGEQMLYTCNRQNLQEAFDLIDCLKVMELRNVAEKYLYDRCPAVAAVGPTEGLPDYSRLRAQMYWLRL